MRTVLASALLGPALVGASTAWANEGHGDAGFHWHGSDLLSVLAMAVAVVLWLWRRGRP